MTSGQVMRHSSHAPLQVLPKSAFGLEVYPGLAEARKSTNVVVGATSLLGEREEQWRSQAPHSRLPLFLQPRVLRLELAAGCVPGGGFTAFRIDLNVVRGRGQTASFSRRYLRGELGIHPPVQATLPELRNQKNLQLSNGKTAVSAPARYSSRAFPASPQSLPPSIKQEEDRSSQAAPFVGWFRLRAAP